MANNVRNVPTTFEALESPDLDVTPQFQTFLDIFQNPDSHYKEPSAIGAADQNILAAFADEWQAGKATDLQAGLADRRPSRSTTSSRRRRSSGRTRRTTRPTSSRTGIAAGAGEIDAGPGGATSSADSRCCCSCRRGSSGSCVLILYPMLSSLYFSFTKYSLLEQPEWIGLAELPVHVHEGSVLLAGDPQHGVDHRWSACRCGSCSAISTAWLLTQPRTGSRVYRTLYFLPSMAPPAAAALAFVLLFNPEFGPDQPDPAAASASTSRRSWFYGPGLVEVGARAPRAVGRRGRDDHLPRGPARRAAPAVRGRRHRGGERPAEVPVRHAADDLAGDLLLARDRRDLRRSSSSRRPTWRASRRRGARSPTPREPRRTRRARCCSTRSTCSSRASSTSAWATRRRWRGCCSSSRWSARW